MAILVNPDIDEPGVYRDLRAAAESGWDFSSRWLQAEGDSTYSLHSIQTTSIIPVDLNCLLYSIENTLAGVYQLTGDLEQYKSYETKAEKRKTAILKYFWNTEEGFFMDYHYPDEQHTQVLSLAGVYPLYFKVANQEQAIQVATGLKELFLKDGGLLSTLNYTGQQWDAPNGWAPLQYLAIIGLRNYGVDELANEIKTRWLKLNERVYYEDYKLLEKYNVVHTEIESF